LTKQQNTGVKKNARKIKAHANNKESITSLNALVHGNARTRLSLVISGFGNIMYGQIIKGLLFLGFQFSVLFIFISFGMEYVSKINTLGTETMRSEYNDALDIFVNVPGDNSLKILLYSIFAVAILVVGITLQLASVKSSYATQLDVKRGKQPNSFAADLRSMLDKNLHTTLLTPPFLGVAAFTLLPIIFMILLAFTNFDRDHQPPGNLFTWVGLQNFIDVLNFGGTKGNTFFGVLGWTLVWAVFATFLNYLFGMVVALMINKKDIRLKGLWRTCFVIAIAVPGFVTLLFMRQMLSEMGTVNVILQSWGFEPVNFLRNTMNARLTVIVVNLWIGIPYTMLITSGILMNIPKDLYEASKIDGAGPLRQFRSITLPYMLAVTTPYLITQFIGNLNNFNAIFFLTQGGPPVTDYYNAGKTDLLITWLYRLTVSFGDYNIASVIGIVTFVICASISLITFNILASAKKEETFS